MIKLSLSFIFLFVFQVSFSQEIYGSSKVSQEVLGYLKEISNNAGISGITITRGSSTPAEQASIMYKYYLKDSNRSCKYNTYEERKQCALNTYGPIGDAAINSISDLKNESQAISEMTRTITNEIKAAGENRNEMTHVPIEGRLAVDINPSSIEDVNKFKASVLNHSKVIKSRFFWPGKSGGPPESAFHIEFIVD
jgi:hypothetical protein